MIGLQRNCNIPEGDIAVLLSRVASFTPVRRCQRCRNCTGLLSKISIWPVPLQPHAGFTARSKSIVYSSYNQVITGNRALRNRKETSYSYLLQKKNSYPSDSSESVSARGHSASSVLLVESSVLLVGAISHLSCRSFQQKTKNAKKSKYDTGTRRRGRPSSPSFSLKIVVAAMSDLSLQSV
jgi:hypothetical protein